MPELGIMKKYGEPHSGKEVGTLFGEGVYLTYRNAKQHFFKIFQGYGISKWILEDLKTIGCVYIDIEEELASMRVRILRSDINKWFDIGKPYTWMGDDQLVLPTAEMMVYVPDKGWVGMWGNKR